MIVVLYTGLTVLGPYLLGIAIDVRTLVRLIEAGFVAGGFVSPGIRQFSFDRYQEHPARGVDDPEVWDRISPPHPSRKSASLWGAIPTGAESL